MQKSMQFALGLASACLVLPSAGKNGDMGFNPPMFVPLRQNPAIDPQSKKPSGFLPRVGRTSMLPKMSAGPPPQDAGDVPYDAAWGGSPKAHTKDPTPVSAEDNSLGKKGAIASGDSFEEYMKKRGGGAGAAPAAQAPAPAATAPAPAAPRSRISYGADGGYDPTNRPAAPAASAPAASAPAASAPAFSAPAASAPASAWKPYGGYDPKNRGGASSTGFKPYGGYDPSNRPAAPAASAPAASAPAASAPVFSAPAASAPASTWKPYGGYDPKNRGGASSSGFKPYGGYDPKNRRAAPQDGAFGGFAPPPAAATAPAPVPAAAMNRPADAPASALKPYGGYDPKSRPGGQEASPNLNRINPSVEEARNIPGVHWSDYVGYDPKNRPADAPASELLPFGGHGPRSAWATVSDDIPCSVDRPVAECLQDAEAKGLEPYGSYNPRMNDGPRVSWTISDDIPCDVDRPVAECLQAAAEGGLNPFGDAGKGPRSSWTTQVSDDIPCLVDQPMSECLAAAEAKGLVPHGRYNPRLNDGPRATWTTQDGPLRNTDDRYAPRSRPAAPSRPVAAPAFKPYGGYDPKKRPAASSTGNHNTRTQRPQEGTLGGPRGSWTTDDGPLRPHV